jgi:hypothetical protein
MDPWRSFHGHDSHVQITKYWGLKKNFPKERRWTFDKKPRKCVGVYHQNVGICAPNTGAYHILPPKLGTPAF